MTTQVTVRPAAMGAVVILAVALLLAAMTAFILFVPVDGSNFETTTGEGWEAFASANPEVADYLTREARLLAVGYLGFALLAAAMAWWPLRRGERWARRALWLFPVTLLGAAVVFLSSGDQVLGGTYLVAGAAAAVALALMWRRSGGSSR